MQAVYKPYVWRSTVINDALTTATRLAVPNGAVVSSSSATIAAASIFYLNATELAITGKTTKLNLQATLSTNATSMGTETLTVALRAISAVAGGTDSSSVTISTSIASVAFVDPATSTSTTSTSGDVDMPASGLYAITVNNTTTPAADSFASLAICLRYRHV